MNTVPDAQKTTPLYNPNHGTRPQFKKYSLTCGFAASSNPRHYYQRLLMSIGRLTHRLWAVRIDADSTR